MKLELIIFSFVGFFVFRRLACDHAIIFVLLGVDLLSVCLSFGPITAIIAFIISVAAVAYSSRSVSMIAYCLDPRSGHLVSTMGSSLSDVRAF